MKKTTVVIPNYNGSKYLKDCLDSLYQGTREADVIVVDNGSTDGSLDLLQKSYPQTPVIALKENTGFSYAVNVGVRAAKTEYVLLLNNDTVSDSRLVEALEGVLDKNPGIFSAAAKMISLSDREKLDGAGDLYCALGWGFARGKDQSIAKYGKGERIFSACGGAALYRKAVLEEIGLFDELHFAYLEDMDVGYRANIYGYANWYEPAAVVYHAGSASSGSRHNAFKVRLSAGNNLYMLYKNMPFLQMIGNLPFLLAGHLIKFLYFIRKGLGGAYLAGLGRGIRLCVSPEGRSHKVPFRWKNFSRYLWIQGQLWLNILRRF